MKTNNKKALLFASALVALAATTSAASAQEAIMLETVGAVRMVPPEELQRRDAEALRQQQTQKAQPALLPRQHAEITQ